MKVDNLIVDELYQVAIKILPVTKRSVLKLDLDIMEKDGETGRSKALIIANEIVNYLVYQH